MVSAVPVFYLSCIHPILTGLFTATSGNGRLRKHLSNSWSLLMLRPLDIVTLCQEMTEGGWSDPLISLYCWYTAILRVLLWHSSSEYPPEACKHWSLWDLGLWPWWRLHPLPLPVLGCALFSAWSPWLIISVQILHPRHICDEKIIVLANRLICSWSDVAYLGSPWPPLHKTAKSHNTLPIDNMLASTLICKTYCPSIRRVQ